MWLRLTTAASILAALLLPCARGTAGEASGPGPGPKSKELEVKRKEVFEFTVRPRVTRDGDRITVEFACKDYCDVAVAVEDPSAGSGQAPKIVRHLAAGVLGKNAPPPLVRNSLQQRIVWNGKDDRGRYIDDKEGLTVRVSLGIKPRYERSLFWSPYKRFGATVPLMQATPEGVYVFDSKGSSQLRLFDHEGVYRRTTYPPPADKLAGMKGVKFKRSPQTGKQVPMLRGFVQCRFLSSGEGAFVPDQTHHGDCAYAATGMAVRGKRVALGFMYLNRLATDGTTGGLPIEGPAVGYKGLRNTHWHKSQGRVKVGPTSMALSPDGRKLYLTGYMWSVYGPKGGNTEAIFHGVRVMDYEKSEEPRTFAGKMTVTGDGKSDGQFAGATSVACDAKGRVYVSDYLNNRVQVFSAEGKFLKSLAVKSPAKVMVGPEGGEIVVFSWAMNSFSHRLQEKYGAKALAGKEPGTSVTWTSLGTFEKPRAAAPEVLPFKLTVGARFFIGQPMEAAYDFWAKEPTVWLAPRKQIIQEYIVMHHGKMAWEDSFKNQWRQNSVLVFARRGGKWVLKRDFEDLTRKAIYRSRPPAFHGQRLTVNPKTGKLYLLEYRGHLGMKSHTELLEIDVATGKVRPKNMPMAAEMVRFDMDGHAYLRDSRMVMRYNFGTWREIPWDYGEERKGVGMAERTNAIAGLALPGRMPCTGHQEGTFVSVHGHLAASCFNVKQTIRFTFGKAYTPGGDYKAYTPPIYPGRIRWQEVHVFDKYGRMRYQDAVPGLAHLSGLAMDEDDYLYVLAGGARAYGGTSPFNPWSGTLMKVKPEKARITGSNPKKGKENAPQVVLAPESYPRRAHDMENSVYGKAWVDGAEWLFGGVGFSGWSHHGGKRHNIGYVWDDWHSRFGYDRYSRCFVHELDNYSIAVVDKNGNLITRFGRYGNEQDGVPLVAAGGATNPKSIGGSEVALARPTTMAADSDRRLFVIDAMNNKILSVKLDYHAEEKVKLRDVPDSAKRK